MILRCPHCGFENYSSYRYCVRCELPITIRNPSEHLKYLRAAQLFVLIFYVLIYYLLFDFWGIIAPLIIVLILFFIPLNRVDRKKCFSDRGVDSIAKNLCDALGLPKNIRVLVCEKRGAFISGNIHNYFVVIPKAILNDETKLVGVLAHELSHIKNKDHIFLRILFTNFVLVCGLILWTAYKIALVISIVPALIGYIFFGIIHILTLLSLKYSYISAEIFADYIVVKHGYINELKKAISEFLPTETHGFILPIFRVHPTLRDRINIIRGGVYSWIPLSRLIGFLLPFLIYILNLIFGLLLWLLIELALRSFLVVLMVQATFIFSIPCIYLFYLSNEYIYFTRDPAIKNFLYSFHNRIFIWLFMVLFSNIVSFGLYIQPTESLEFAILMMGYTLPSISYFVSFFSGVAGIAVIYAVSIIVYALLHMIGRSIYENDFLSRRGLLNEVKLKRIVEYSVIVLAVIFMVFFIIAILLAIINLLELPSPIGFNVFIKVFLILAIFTFAYLLIITPLAGLYSYKTSKMLGKIEIDDRSISRLRMIARKVFIVELVLCIVPFVAMLNFVASLGDLNLDYASTAILYILLSFSPAIFVDLFAYQRFSLPFVRRLKYRRSLMVRRVQEKQRVYYLLFPVAALIIFLSSIVPKEPDMFTMILTLLILLQNKYLSQAIPQFLSIRAINVLSSLILLPFLAPYAQSACAISLVLLFIPSLSSLYGSETETLMELNYMVIQLTEILVLIFLFVYLISSRKHG